MNDAGLLSTIKFIVIPICYMAPSIGLRDRSRGSEVASGLTNLAFSVVSDKFHKVRG